MNWFKVRDYYSNNSYLVNVTSIASIKEVSEFDTDKGCEVTLVQINLVGFDIEDYLTVETSIDQITDRVAAFSLIQELSS